MNRVITILTLVALVYLVACKKSSNSNSTSAATTSDSAMIIGKWTPIHEAIYFYSLTGQLITPQDLVVSPLDYLNFDNGLLYSGNYDPSNNIPFLDTASYHIYNSQYLVTYNSTDGYDTVKLQFSHDTLVFTDIQYNTIDLNGDPANEYDTTISVRHN